MIHLDNGSFIEREIKIDRERERERERKERERKEREKERERHGIFREENIDDVEHK